MTEWNRSTEKLPLENISPDMRSTMDEHLESYNLGPILDDYLICIQTTSEKRKKGLFGGGMLGVKIPKHVIQVAVLTPGWLVICAQSEKQDSTTALSVPLKDALVEDYQNTPDYDLIADCGVYVTGIYTGRVGMQGNQRIKYFLGLGEEAAAAEFKDILFQAIQKTRKTKADSTS